MKRKKRAQQSRRRRSRKMDLVERKMLDRE
jgi:hypothetical protein